MTHEHDSTPTIEEVLEELGGAFYALRRELKKMRKQQAKHERRRERDMFRLVAAIEHLIDAHRAASEERGELREAIKNLPERIVFDAVN